MGEHEVVGRIRVHTGQLTAAERRVAEVVLADPRTIGFGTVAELAARAGAGAATVVRLATKLGYEGFSELQESVRRDLAHQLRPASERIREQAGPGVVEMHAATELSNVQGTLERADPATVDAVVERLTALDRPVAVVSGDASTGVARQFVDELTSLRPDVIALVGNDVAVRRTLATLPADTTLLVLDLRRYDRWVLDLVALAREHGCWIVALTDSILSPLAGAARHTFMLSAASVGPFDSHVGTLALLNLFVTETAARLGETAPERLDRIEASWRDGQALVDRLPS
ncbi:MurR/RpiR family transcriptional regulator [soil metagenome]